MKCIACKGIATENGSGLCLKCEKEVLDEHYRKQEDLMQEVYMDIINSQH